jgi:hypothetical protein
MLHFVPAIRRWFPKGNVAMFIQPLSRRFSAAVSVTPLLFPATPQETAPRGYAESRTDGNRADPNRECSYPG